MFYFPNIAPNDLTLRMFPAYKFRRIQICSFGVLYLYTEVGLLIMSLGFCVQILTYSLVKSCNLLTLSDRRIFLFYYYAPSIIRLLLRHDMHDRPAYVLQTFS